MLSLSNERSVLTIWDTASSKFLAGISKIDNQDAIPLLQEKIAGFRVDIENFQIYGTELNFELFKNDCEIIFSKQLPAFRGVDSSQIAVKLLEILLLTVLMFFIVGLVLMSLNQLGILCGLMTVAAFNVNSLVMTSGGLGIVATIFSSLTMFSGVSTRKTVTASLDTLLAEVQPMNQP